ncbi:MAG: acylphosphatase [Nanoarchaeota archaeon]
MREIKIKIYGRVQGVNFRVMTRDFCDENEIKGNVMNSDDGSVLVVAQADDDRLRKLIEWAKSSPGFSRVDDVRVVKCEIARKYKDFGIIREDSFFRDQKNSFRNLGKSFGRN